jgi:hypothetical protein
MSIFKRVPKYVLGSEKSCIALRITEYEIVDCNPKIMRNKIENNDDKTTLKTLITLHLKNE